MYVDRCGRCGSVYMDRAEDLPSYVVAVDRGGLRIGVVGVDRAEDLLSYVD